MYLYQRSSSIGGNLGRMNLVLEGIKYRLHAKKRQGIHSPFVYALADRALREKIPEKVNSLLKAFDIEQNLNRQMIDFEDFGAGSKRLGKQRSVREIHRFSSSKKYSKLLFRLAHFYQPQRILELGTSLGRGTLSLHLAHPTAKIFTLEGCKAVAEIAEKNLKQWAINATNLSVIHAKFHDFLSQSNHQPFDLIYLDGHHDGEALLQYCSMLEPCMHENTLLILDDIRWSASMKRAWMTLVESPNYHVSIDFFRMGLLLKRPMQSKEHFILRG